MHGKNEDGRSSDVGQCLSAFDSTSPISRVTLIRYLLFVILTQQIQVRLERLPRPILNVVRLFTVIGPGNVWTIQNAIIRQPLRNGVRVRESSRPVVAANVRPQDILFTRR